MDTLLLLADLTKHHNLFIPATVFNADKDGEVVPFVATLLVDTGASATAIDKKFLETCGYNDYNKPAGEKQIADRVASFPTCEVLRLQLGNEFKITGHCVDVISLDKRCMYNGLLGMDILSRLNLIISKEHHKFILTNQSLAEAIRQFKPKVLVKETDGIFTKNKK